MPVNLIRTLGLCKIIYFGIRDGGDRNGNAFRDHNIATTEIGLATLDELKAAIAAVNKGPLSEAALARLTQLQAGFLGEAR